MDNFQLLFQADQRTTLTDVKLWNQRAQLWRMLIFPEFKASPLGDFLLGTYFRPGSQDFRSFYIQNIYQKWQSISSLHLKKIVSTLSNLLSTVKVFLKEKMFSSVWLFYNSYLHSKVFMYFLCCIRGLLIFWRIILTYIDSLYRPIILKNRFNLAKSLIYRRVFLQTVLFLLKEKMFSSVWLF